MCHQYPQDTHLVGLLVRQADEHGQDEDVEGVGIVATQAHKEHRRAHTEHCRNTSSGTYYGDLQTRMLK